MQLSHHTPQHNYWPICLSAIIPLWPSDLSPAFATFKPFRLVLGQSVYPTPLWLIVQFLYWISLHDTDHDITWHLAATQYWTWTDVLDVKSVNIVREVSMVGIDSILFKYYFCLQWLVATWGLFLPSTGDFSDDLFDRNIFRLYSALMEWKWFGCHINSWNIGTQAEKCLFKCSFNENDF